MITSDMAARPSEGRDGGNSRNARRAEIGAHRHGTGGDFGAPAPGFEFRAEIVAKRQRRLTGVDEMVISLSAKGLTDGEIAAHLAEVYGAEVSKQTVARSPTG